jgi:hypothetical protein
MSFGFSVGEIIGLTQLAWQVVDNCRRACGEHDELTRVVASLHSVLRHLEQEATSPASLLNRQDETSSDDLSTSIEGCRRVLSVLDIILGKYNALGEEKRAGDGRLFEFLY